MQSLFDSRFNTIYGHSAAFSCRVITVSLLLCGCLLFMAIRKPQSALEAVILTIIIGVLSGTAYGTFMQIVTMIEDHRANAAFAFGFQGSGVVVLILSALSNMPAHSIEGFNISSGEVEQFFISCAACQLLSLFAFIILRGKDCYNHSMRLAKPSVDYKDKEGERSGRGFFEVASKMPYILSSLTLTIFASILLLPFYSYVKCSSHDRFWGSHCGNISTYLFYCKVIPDACSRPLTVYMKILEKPTALFIFSILRSFIAVIFFLYLTTDWLGEWSAPSICILNACFSFCSGYIITTSYSMASKLSEGCPEGAISIAKVMNCAFQLALLLALASAFALQTFLHL